MAEFLVRIAAHAHSTPQTAHLHVGPYEIVDVQENLWPWTPTELNHPQWRIISIPNVTVAAFAYWADAYYEALSPSSFLKRRWRLDETQIADIVAGWQSGIVNVVPPGDRNKIINAIVDKRVP